jgi:hypothetical protein
MVTNMVRLLLGCLNKTDWQTPKRINTVFGNSVDRPLPIGVTEVLDTYTMILRELLLQLALCSFPKVRVCCWSLTWIDSQSDGDHPIRINGVIHIN